MAVAVLSESPPDSPMSVESPFAGPRSSRPHDPSSSRGGIPSLIHWAGPGSFRRDPPRFDTDAPASAAPQDVLDMDDEDDGEQGSLNQWERRAPAMAGTTRLDRSAGQLKPGGRQRMRLHSNTSNSSRSQHGADVEDGNEAVRRDPGSRRPGRGRGEASRSQSPEILVERLPGTEDTGSLEDFVKGLDVWKRSLDAGKSQSDDEHGVHGARRPGLVLAQACVSGAGDQESDEGEGAAVRNLLRSLRSSSAPAPLRSALRRKEEEEEEEDDDDDRRNAERREGERDRSDAGPRHGSVSLSAVGVCACDVKSSADVACANGTGDTPEEKAGERRMRELEVEGWWETAQEKTRGREGTEEWEGEEQEHRENSAQKGGERRKEVEGLRGEREREGHGDSDLGRGREGGRGQRRESESEGGKVSLHKEKDPRPARQARHDICPAYTRCMQWPVLT
eukprot:1850005-Rhodomonas_salina.2